MIHRVAISASALCLAVVLLINFHGPEVTPVAAVGNDQGGGTASAGGSAGAGNMSASGSGGSSGSTGTAGSSGSTGSANSSGTSGPTASPTGGSTAGTYAGAVVQEPYGYVQVQITVQGGKVTDVKALELPTGGHSGRISSFVAPILRTEALRAQSARIDLISGATYTSEAYAMSLQSALDAARV